MRNGTSTDTDLTSIGADSFYFLASISISSCSEWVLRKFTSYVNVMTGGCVWRDFGAMVVGDV